MKTITLITRNLILRLPCHGANDDGTLFSTQSAIDPSVVLAAEKISVLEFTQLF